MGLGALGALLVCIVSACARVVGVVSGVPLLISVDLATLGRLGWKERVVCVGTEPPTWDTPPAGEEYSEVRSTGRSQVKYGVGLLNLFATRAFSGGKRI